MIFKASRLLELFIEEECKKLESFHMPHMPTLGSAYEEVTKQGIDQKFVIPEGLNLKVVSGFISIDGEMLPEQIDCMLVHGRGEKYGLTEQYIYEIDKVLCIFEVKKTLRKNDYSDAFDHLAKIRRKFAAHFEEKLKNSDFEPKIGSARHCFSRLTGKIAPEHYREINNLSAYDALLFYVFVQESCAPVSIIQGYGGYGTEKGLRSAFIDILEEKRKNGGQGLGIPRIPSLVTSNQFCLVKANGLPFTVIQDKDSWVSVFSTRHNSAKIILELIWAKISAYFNAVMPWNDGLQMESIRPLLIAKPVETDKATGWEYTLREFKEKSLKREDDVSWAPSPLGKPEVAAIRIMAMRGGYLALDEGLNEYLMRKYNVALGEVIENLLLTRQFMRDGDHIRPLNPVTHLITKDDETGFVSWEREKLDLWCENNNVKPYYLNLLFME